MTPPPTWVTLLATSWLLACPCSNVDLDAETSSSTSEGGPTASSAATDGSTGEPFDATRWIGRYHFENVFLPFGERGDSHGASSLINFEILPDSRATIFYDACSFDEPVIRSYEWSPSEHGWIDLQPGLGEPWLRFLGPDQVGTLRVQMIDSCRELRFEIDGRIDTWSPVRPGESCWVDRCTTPNIMQVGYCEGEEPPPCP